jgi:phage terminase small subunit
VPRAAKDPGTGLTQQQENFCVQYVTGEQGVAGNGSECVRRTFNYKRSKASTIQRKAKEILNMGTIQARIAILRASVAKTAGIKAADILREASLMAMARPYMILNEDGSLKPWDEWPEPARAALAGIDVEAMFDGRGEEREHVGNVKKYKFFDKNAAMERMFKHFGLFEKDNRQRVDPVAALLAAIDGHAKLAPAGAAVAKR